MNIKSILVAMAATGLATTAFAGDVQVYGKINTSIQKTDLDAEEFDGDRWELNSNASRVGVKGSHGLSHGLKAIYKAEYEITNDDDRTFRQRNIYAGLQGNFGTVIAGRHDTPTKMLGKVVDRFNDQLIADLGETFTGDQRSNNTVMYSSPRISGVKGTLALVQGEIPNSERDGLADGRSLTLDYKNSSVNVGLGYDSDVDGEDIDRLRFVAGVKVGPAKLAAMYQDVDYDGPEEKGFLVSAAGNVTPNVTLKAQYGQNDFENAAGDNVLELSTLALGADYKLSKKAKAYTYIAQNKEDLSDAKAKTGGVGLEVKF